ncbi:MAG: antiterminator Q family protein [Planctomycetota bacterium]|jgi:RNA polymerase sigma-70 factor (ECF subfamily)|nr:antiterminator Q family protein [Planctomycetota bacterium]
MDDCQLITDAQGGDTDAFCELVARHQGPIRAYLAALVFEPESVFDLAQDVFLTAHNKLADFDATRDLGAWLRGIARTTALAHNRAAARRTRREHTAAQLALALAAEREQAPDERLTALHGCLRQLAHNRPEVLHLLEQRYTHETALSALARELSIAEGALRVRLLRARQILRHCIDTRIAAEP